MVRGDRYNSRLKTGSNAREGSGNVHWLLCAFKDFADLIIPFLQCSTYWELWLFRRASYWVENLL